MGGIPWVADIVDMSSGAPMVTDWTLGTDNRGRVIDVERLLWPETTDMHPSVFRRTPTDSWPVDVERANALVGMIEEYRKWNLGDVTSGHVAGALRRFVRWVDQKSGENLSRKTIVPLLLRYNRDTRSRQLLLRRAASGLALTEHESALLFPPPLKALPPECEWIVSWTYATNRFADFARLLRPGDASLATNTWKKNRPSLLLQALKENSERAAFVRALRSEFEARIADGSLSPGTLSSYWQNLQRWIIWCDENEVDLTEHQAVEALQSYATHRTAQWRGGMFMARTAHSHIGYPLQLVASVLRKPAYEIKLRLSLPPLKASGWTSAAPDLSALQDFCANLSTIIKALTADRLLARLDSPLKASLLDVNGDRADVELPRPHGGFGNSIEPRVANLPLIRLRIWAELSRYIAITGCNLSLARDLTFEQHKSSAPRWKGRAGKFVSVRSGKVYARHLENHEAFLQALFPNEINDSAPMFPSIHTNANSQNTMAALDRIGQLRLVVGPSTEKSFNFIVPWLRNAGCSVFGSRELRATKSSWLLRRYGGDSLQTSRDLGNTPQVAMSHYGGKGNLEWAKHEWSELWANERRESALASGGCDAPGQFTSVMADRESGGCIETGCFECVHYRAEDSLDYIHRVLTYQRLLSYRAPANAAVERPIALIDLIIRDYLIRHPEHSQDIKQLRGDIHSNPHTNFEVMLRLEQIRC